MKYKIISRTTTGGKINIDESTIPVKFNTFLRRTDIIKIKPDSFNIIDWLADFGLSIFKYGSTQIVFNEGRSAAPGALVGITTGYQLQPNEFSVKTNILVYKLDNEDTLVLRSVSKKVIDILKKEYPKLFFA